MIISSAVNQEYCFTVDTGGVLTRSKLDVDGHFSVMPVPPGSPITVLTASDPHLFALLANGEVWRFGRHAEVWDKLNNIPLGATFIATTQDALQIVHGSGSVVSALKLPGDTGLTVTDTGGLSGIIQIHGDEKQRILLLNDGSLFLQRYTGGAPEPVNTPGPVTYAEIGSEYLYMVSGTEVYRVKDYESGAPDKLAGVSNVSLIAVSSDHLDRLKIFEPNGDLSEVFPSTWSVPIPAVNNDGWVYGDPNAAGEIGWAFADDWVVTA